MTEGERKRGRKLKKDSYEDRISYSVCCQYDFLEYVSFREQGRSMD
jgi:hypothetical protein